jgi:beta-lactamase regulating signal transducer with metallopeptidase domain
MWPILSDPLAQRLTWALVHFLWQGAALAALLAILLRTRLGLTPQRRYAASVAALALMALCTVLTCASVDSAGLTGDDFSPLHQEAIPSIRQPSTPSELAPLTGVTHLDWLGTLQPYLLSAWVCGVVLLGIRLISGYAGTVWLRRGRATLPMAVAARVEELCGSLGIVAARVYASSRVREALAVGFWRPVVLVPLAWLTELPADVLEAVIAHELAHIRRWDRWGVLFQRGMETLLFYHPAVWWVSRTISFERELCCDELAVAATGRRLAYARALEAAGQRSLARVSLIFATSFQGEPDMKLLARVRNVLGLQPQREAGLAWPAGVLVVVLGLGVSGWTLSTALADEDKPGEKPAKAAAEGAQKDAPRKSAEAEQPPRKVSPEAEAAKRKSAEAGKAKSAEAEALQRKLIEAKQKSAEAEKARLSDYEAAVRKAFDAKAKAAEKEGVKAKLAEEYKRKLAEGERPKEGTGLPGFKPETDREAALFKLIQDLRQEVAQLRREVSQMRGGKEGDAKTVLREGDVKKGTRDGEVKKGPRDGEAVKPGPRDGEGAVKKGPRDGDVPAKAGPRDGDAPVKKGARDGEDAPR